MLEAFREDVEADRIVILAHSQGTIIAANVLRAVRKALAAEKQRKWARLSPRRARAAARTVAHHLTTQADERTLALRESLCEALVPFFTDPVATRRKVKKLEIYTFANCADQMRHVFRDRAGHPWPHLEHFANERDLVARLGVLSPLRDLIHVDGPVYVRQEAWGHLLNEHYLLELREHLTDSSQVPNPYVSQDPEGPERPRLYRYFGGM